MDLAFVRGRRDNNHSQVNFKGIKESSDGPIKSDIATDGYSIKKSPAQ
jgi:hypothetical protein